MSQTIKLRFSSKRRWKKRIFWLAGRLSFVRIFRDYSRIYETNDNISRFIWRLSYRSSGKSRSSGFVNTMWNIYDSTIKRKVIFIYVRKKKQYSFVKTWAFISTNSRGFISFSNTYRTFCIILHVILWRLQWVEWVHVTWEIKQCCGPLSNDRYSQKMANVAGLL